MKKRSVNIAGHQTSISLEEAFWDALKTLAEQQGKSLNRLVGEIDKSRGRNNLSSAIRVYVLKKIQGSS
jgi:predicted DNA-binding ribbon-helix-helix protein